MYLFEFTKSLLVKSNFYDQIGAYIRYAAQDDPSLQDLLDAHSDSAGTVVLFLMNEKNSDGVTLKFAIEDGMYKDEVALNKILADPFINNSKTVKGILSLAVNDIEYLKKAYKQHDWLERFTIIADRLDALKSNLFSRYENTDDSVEIEPAPPLTLRSEVVNEISLPESFKLPDLLKHFSPILSQTQTAIFLYYLREAKIIPEYSDASLGKVAEFFLGRSQNTVRKSLGEIHHILSEHPSELESLKAHLQALISLIDKKIK